MLNLLTIWVISYINDSKSVGTAYENQFACSCEALIGVRLINIKLIIILAT
jgi:hypothetical protein